MSPINYFTKVLKNYAVFEGRARRSEYWYFYLFTTLISWGLMAVDTAMGLEDFGISLIWSLAVMIPFLAVAVRRMHDVGKSGWFILIPIYNFILAVTPGEEGANEYGPDPKNPDAVRDISDHLVE
ncbi:MAG: DUF805 domain-containing protein [Bacteroidota bacterium]